MKIIETVVSVITAITLSVQLSLGSTDLYVSPKGDDSNPGTKRSP